MKSSSADWISAEFATTSFGDERLNKRFKKILESSLSRSQSTISSCFDSWGEVKGAYRFLANDKIDYEKIISPHFQATAERIRGHETVLLIQDTVYLDFKNREKTDGLDVVWKRGEGFSDPIRGLILHNMLAVTVQGLPLGILRQKYICRKGDLGPVHRSCRYWNNPIEDKESFRWVQNVHDMKQFDFGSTETVHVADREGDIYEMFRDCHDEAARFLIRACNNRSINKEKRREPPSEKLFDMLRSKRAAGRVKVRIQCNGKKKFREAELSIIFAPITIPPPPNKTRTKDGDNLIMVPMNAIMAIERNPPAGIEPLEWVLLTNLDVADIKSAIEKVKWYSLRWNIEVFHKILKSGCNVEKIQMRSSDRLKNMIAIKCIVAWRLFWIARELEINPNDSCERVLTKIEWQVLYRKFVGRTPFPESPPSVSDVHRWIGKLGGFIGRTSDGCPGVMSMWKGWERFMVLLEDYETFSG